MSGRASDSVKIKVDGIELVVAKGTTVVDAAHQMNIEVPIFCHHPKLEPVGMCRMCMVEVGRPRVDRATGQVVLDEETGTPVIDFGPKPVTGCTTFVDEGMEVRTTTEVVREARDDVLEFLLTSHPLDCPVCDKGGECPLQNLTLRYGPGKSRFPWGEKYRFPKPVPIGPLIALDRERCVLCARCIRFQDEIAGDPVLDFESRARGMEVISVSDPPFDSYFSGNTSDICPVGALTTKDFRFEARAWEVVPRGGICVHCPVGCNVAYDVRSSAIERVMPRENEFVNEIWLCDKGRFAHHYASSPERLTQPLVRVEGELVEASWSQALDLIHDRLSEIKQREGADAIGGIAGDSLANEDLYLFGRFMRAIVGTNNVDHRPGIHRNDLIDRAGAGAETNLADLGAGTTVVVVGLDVEEEAPVIYLNLQKAKRAGSRLIVVGGRPQKLERIADVSLRHRYGAEASLVSALRALMAAGGAGTGTGVEAAVGAGGAAEGVGKDASSRRVGKATGPQDVLSSGLSGEHPVRAEDLSAAAEAIASAEGVLVLYGREAALAGLDQQWAEFLFDLGMVGRTNCGLLAVGPHANSQGAADMGVLPDWLPGYQPVGSADVRSGLADLWPAEPPEGAGLGAESMLAGGVKALYLVGTDPAADDPRYAEALENMDFVVVQELFPTESARRADVVLPALAAPEREGTYTNYARRVQRFHRAVQPLDDAKPDWEILRDLAILFGVPEPYDTAADVMAEITLAVPQYGRFTYDRLGSAAPPTPGDVFLPFAPITSARNVQYHGTAYQNRYGIGLAWQPGSPRLNGTASESTGSSRHGGTQSLEPRADAHPGRAAEDAPKVPHGLDEDPQAAGAPAQAAGAPAQAAGAPAQATGKSTVGGDESTVGGTQMTLVVGSKLYDRGTLVRASLVLHPLTPDPAILMSPFDANPRGIFDGTRVSISNARGTVTGEVQVTDGLTPGVVVAHRSMGWDTPVESLLGGAASAPVTVALIKDGA